MKTTITQQIDEHTKAHFEMRDGAAVLTKLVIYGAHYSREEVLEEYGPDRVAEMETEANAPADELGFCGVMHGVC